jgi:hypothetical protein
MSFCHLCRGSRYEQRLVHTKKIVASRQELPCDGLAAAFERSAVPTLRKSAVAPGNYAGMMTLGDEHDRTR